MVVNHLRYVLGAHPPSRHPGEFLLRFGIWGPPQGSPEASLKNSILTTLGCQFGTPKSQTRLRRCLGGPQTPILNMVFAWMSIGTGMTVGFGMSRV